MRDGVDNYDLKRENLSMDTPDGKTIPLATQAEYRGASELRAVEATASRVVRDSINYFPPKATRACRLAFFAPVGSRALAYDETELNNRLACVGRPCLMKLRLRTPSCLRASEGSWPLPWSLRPSC